MEYFDLIQSIMNLFWT